jgi:hypothetical protein
MPDKPLSTLSHHVDIEWLTEAYRRTRKSGAAGVALRRSRNPKVPRPAMRLIPAAPAAACLVKSLGVSSLVRAPLAAPASTHA